MIAVIDIEANGFLQEVDTVWCLVGKDIETGHVTKICNGDVLSTLDTYKDMCEYMSTVDTWIGHNVIDYDIPLLDKVLGYEYKGAILDTYIMSQMACPDRKGGHALANFGEIFGREKPEHEDWNAFSTDMLHRCSEDVEINHMAYDYVMKELVEKI